ncbi:MAG: hypothetical protein WB788_05645 [Thermoplasmata archaeon]
MTAVSRRSLKIVGVAAAIGTLLLVLGLTLYYPAPVRFCACPIGPEFVVGNPAAGVCPSAGTFATTGCLAGDFVYNLTIEASTFNFGNVLFHVTSRNGTVVVATGGQPGFSILHTGGAVAADFPAPGGVLAMTSGWSYAPRTNSSTPLTSLYSILVDMGTSNPVERGYSFVEVGTGGAVGSSTLALP